MSLIFLLLLSLAPRLPAAPPAYFSPAHRIVGIGADRDDLSAEQLALRAAHMIESQTFAIMREPEALPGARRITADPDRKSTRLNSSHLGISYAVFCLKKHN